MTPEQIATLTALAGIVKSIGTWPVASLIMLVLLGPWIILIFLSINMYKWFRSVVQMYENNVTVVNETIELGKDFREMSGGYRELITWAVTTVTATKEMAEKNQFCPIIRKQTNPKDINA